MLSRFFRLHENGTTVGRELQAGLTTFAAMAYVLAVNPSILVNAGMDRPALVTITFNTAEATAAGRYSFRPPGATADSGPYAIVPTRTFAPGTILTLYSNGTANYTYAVGTVARTFDLKGSTWIPQP